MYTRPVDPTLAVRVELAIAEERRAFASSTATSRPEAASLNVAGGWAVYTGHGLFSNRAFGLGLVALCDGGDLDRIEEFYAARGATTQIEVASIVDPSLVHLLRDRGYRLLRFRHIFARHTDGQVPPSDLAPGLDIEAVVTANREEWSSVLIEGFGYEDANEIRLIEEWNEALLTTPRLTALVARFGAEAVGSASVLMDGSVAVLGGAATRPAFRRRGVHLGLIAARVDLARRAGCDLVVVTADPGSTSARNSERAGFHLVCTHSVLEGPGSTRY